MTATYEGLPLWEVEIQARAPLTAVVLIAAPSAAAAEEAARRMKPSDMYFVDDPSGLEVYGPCGATPALHDTEEPDLIVREGAA